MGFSLDLNTVWFLLGGVLLIGYVILDGFDLGVGSLFYLLGKNDEEKRILISSIGPFWDGNEVWLLTGGGALFAAFPIVYASVFSGFYLAMMLVLVGLIFRAVGVEFRNKFSNPVLQGRLDFLFCLGSFLPALLFGVAVGNIIEGLPLDPAYNYTGGFFGLLNPYALLIGLLGLFAFLLQGITYTMLKTEGVVQNRARGLFPKVWAGFVVLYLLATVFTFLAVPELFANFSKFPVLYAFPLLVVIGMALAPAAVKGARYGPAFFASSLTFAGMILTLAAGMFPKLVRAVDPNLSLTIYNAASSQLTLKAMLIIALIGMPVVLFYTIYVYRVFRGKMKLSQEEY